MTTTDMQTKFSNVSCSQCGRDFGPGNSGFSDCRSHAFRDWLYREGCLLDAPTKDQCVDAQRRAFEAVLASRPDAQADERGATPRYVEWLHLRQHGQWIDGVPEWARDHDGRMNDMTAAIAVIEELARVVAPQAEAAQGVADGWRLMPPSLTQSMRMAMGTAAAEYMKRTGGNSLDVIYEAGFAAAPDREHEVPCAKLVGRWDYGKPGCVRYEPDFPRGDIPEGTPVYVGSAPSPDREQVGEHSQCCDTPSYCSSVRRCTAQDASPSRECGERQGASAVVREALESAFEERNGWRVKVAAAVRTIGAASAPTLGEQQWPSDRDAAIQACALMILGICKTEPQEVWPKRIEGRIRYMLSKLQPQAAEPKGLTGFDVALNALDEYQHNWDTGLPS